MIPSHVGYSCYQFATTQYTTKFYIITLKYQIKYKWVYGAYGNDIIAAILVFQDNETVALLVCQTNPVGVQLFLV